MGSKVPQVPVRVEKDVYDFLSALKRRVDVLDEILDWRNIVGPGKPANNADRTAFQLAREEYLQLRGLLNSDVGSNPPQMDHPSTFIRDDTLDSYEDDPDKPFIVSGDSNEVITTATQFDMQDAGLLSLFTIPSKFYMEFETGRNDKRLDPAIGFMEAFRVHTSLGDDNWQAGNSGSVKDWQITRMGDLSSSNRRMNLRVQDVSIQTTNTPVPWPDVNRHMIAIDTTTGELWVGSEGVWYPDAGANTGDPENGLYPWYQDNDLIGKTLFMQLVAKKQFSFTGMYAKAFLESADYLYAPAGFSAAPNVVIFTDESFFKPIDPTVNGQATLPTGSSWNNRTLVLKKTDAGTDPVEIVASGGDDIDGASKIELTAQYECVRLRRVGNRWHVISWYVP